MTEKLPRSVIEPKNPRLNASRRGNLPHVPGIRVGPYIFLSGMGPIDPVTGERNHGPIAEQIRTTLSNMQHMLESAGSSLEARRARARGARRRCGHARNGAGVPRILSNRSARAHGLVDATQVRQRLRNR